MWFHLVYRCLLSLSEYCNYVPSQSTSRVLRPVESAQAIFCRRRPRTRRAPQAKIRPGSPAPAMGPGTWAGFPHGVVKIAVPTSPCGALGKLARSWLKVKTSVMLNGCPGATPVNVGKVVKSWSVIVVEPTSVPPPTAKLSQNSPPSGQTKICIETESPFVPAGISKVWKMLGKVSGLLLVTAPCHVE